ncbi:MAG: AAA family ATPase [Cytophagales bacterium]|nr:AAA family ATPase [Armatimonadota bacterium]
MNDQTPTTLMTPANPLTPEAELHYTRGLLHLRRGEAVMPYAMSLAEEKTPPGTDVLLALLGLASVATARVLGQTGWIETYRAEMRQALVSFDRAVELAPHYAEAHFRRARALRHLGENDPARDAVRRATLLDPENSSYAALRRVLEGSIPIPQRGSASPPGMPPVPLRPPKIKPSPIPLSAEESAVLTWDDVILPAKTKRELRQTQLVLENPHQARALGVEPPTGLLLYGPPGTGKTTVARVLAAQARCSFLTTSPAETNNMWVGESEKNVARLFADARACAPAIVFLDEVDALLPNRAGGMHQYSDKVVNQFLHEMDGLSQNQGVFVVGATNRPDMLDPALLRGGRLSRQIEIPLPEHDARQALLQNFARRAQLDPSVDFALLALQTEGFSGADLRALVNEAGLQALIRIADADLSPTAQALTAADFAVGIENLRRD